MMGLLQRLFSSSTQSQPALKEAGPFSATGVVVSALGGSTNIPGRTTLVTKSLPMGAGAKLLTWFARVTDQAGADQVYFQLCRNGFPISGYERIPGIQSENQNSYEINEYVRPGEISIRAVNISGMSLTIESDAMDIATPVKCQAGFTGQLLSERGGI